MQSRVSGSFLDSGKWTGGGTRKGKRGKKEVAEKKAEHNSVK